MSPLEWTCQRCTYLHQYPSQRCSMCNALRVSKQQMRDFVAGNNKRRIDIDIDNDDIDNDVSNNNINNNVDGLEAVNMVMMNGPSGQSSGGVVNATEEASDIIVGEFISSASASTSASTSASASAALDKQQQQQQQQQQQPSIRRLGLLACPNSASLGWGGDSSSGSSPTIDLTAATKTATPDKKKSSKAATSHSSSPMKMNVDNTMANAKNENDEEAKAKDATCADNVAAATASVINASSSSPSDNRKKRPRLSLTSDDPDMPHGNIDQKQQPQQTQHILVGQAKNDSKMTTTITSNNEEELSEFQEPMKGGGDNNNGYHSNNHGNIVTSMVNNETAQPSSAASSMLLPKKNDSIEVLQPLSVTLDYEPISISMSDESMINTTKERNRSQILTISYNNNNHQQGGADVLRESLVFVVGTISGKAKLDVLPSLDSSPDSSNKEEAQEAEDSKSCRHPPEISLDVFGYRMQQQQHQQTTKHNNSDSIIVNRPDWMLALPLSVVVKTNCHHGTTNKNGKEQPQEDKPTMLRVRIQSIHNERDDQKETITSVYSAYPEESYQLDLLPPNTLRSKNYTAAGSGVCTILESWKDTLDAITEGGDTGMAMSSSNRILLCGAKGVGKSTLLRYATNRLLSSTITADTTPTASLASSSAAAVGGLTNPTIPSHHRRRYRRVAILDLDCGQSELSPPGMLTLTIVSRPLISDPPVHMVCGGSCDHYGTLAMQEEDSIEHVGAYYFGDITSKADPDTYIQMTSQLMGRYNELLQKEDGGEGNDDIVNRNLPLLINTDGWVKGLGFEILSAIIGVVNPRHIIQIMGTTKAKSFDMSSHATTAAAAAAHEHSSHPQTQQPQRRLVHVIQSFDESLLPASLDDDVRSMSSYRSVNSTGSTTSSGALSASSADHRIHRICTYFVGGYNQMMNLRPKKIPGVNSNEGICFHKQSGLHDPNNVIGMTLASMCPYAVPFQSVQLYPPPGLLDEMISGVDRPPCWGIRGNLAHSDVLDSLNGSIVGLCRSPYEAGMPLSTTTHCNNAGSGVPILNCVGLGIIRSIDHTRKIFFVLTPVHPSLLGNVTAFVGGSISLPLQCVYRGVHSDAFPFLSCGHSLTSSTLGADVMKSRNSSRKK